ncbi:MAG: GNAT family N-acetyltransferase [Edaphobacter sp.]
MIVRAAEVGDRDVIWSILEPVIRAGETYTLDREMSRDAALGYWFSSGHEVFVAEDGGAVVGTYYLRANHGGGGSHVANCGYVTASNAMGKGVARAMCEHSLERARSRGFKAMQFNFVVGSNERAVRLWQSYGFNILCRLPKAFLHPQLGYVDAFVMFREL